MPTLVSSASWSLINPSWVNDRVFFLAQAVEDLLLALSRVPQAIPQMIPTLVPFFSGVRDFKGK